MRDAGEHAIELRAGSVVRGHGDRALIGDDRLLPHADHRVDVRGHVLGVRRRRRDPGVLVGHGDATVRQRGEVIAVDQVVRHARMVGILLVDRLQDRDRLQQRIHVLVIERLVQRQRVEDLGLDVVGILLDERLHGLLVVLRPRVLIDGLVVLVERLQRGEPVALALGLGADGLALFDRLQAFLQCLRGERRNERVRALADGDTPVRDRAARVRLGDRGERLDRLREEEGVLHRQRALELFLRFRRAGRLEDDAAELLAARLGLVVMRRDRRRGEDQNQAEDRRKNRVTPHHVVPPGLDGTGGAQY